MQKNILVEKQNENKRLDKFLRESYPQYSRSFLQKIIKNGGVKINGQNTNVHHFLKTGEIIDIDFKPPDEFIIRPDKKNKPPIIFENEDFFILDKPAGLLVHPAPGHQESSLAEQLLAYFPEIKKVGDESLRPGIVHRLDKEVSGLIVVAKNQKTFDHLKQQFKSHKVKKEYWALVKGKVEKREGIINFSIGRSKEGNFVARPRKEEGKKALTKYQLLKNIKNYSLLKIQTLTGRTHQIRLHLKALGHSIVGDNLYKNKKEKENIKINRLFLHALSLGFYDFDKKWRQFKSDLPEELKKIITSLES